MPIRVLSLGAGVQSSALLLMADRHEGPFADKPIDIAVFSDTQNELPDTMEWLDYLESVIKNVKIIRTTKGDLAKDGDFIIPAYMLTPIEDGPQQMLMGSAARKYKKGRGNRVCTVDYKLEPVRTAVRRYLGCGKGKRIKPFLKGKKVTMTLGISTDEASRIKSSKIPWAENWYPLCEDGLMWNRTDCENYVKKVTGKIPPRSACYFCPLHNGFEWFRLKENFPEWFERACLYDEEMRRTKGFNGKMRGELFLHKDRKPLREAFLDKNDKGKSMINECEGLCGN